MSPKSRKRNKVVPTIYITDNSVSQNNVLVDTESLGVPEIVKKINEWFNNIYQNTEATWEN